MSTDRDRRELEVLYRLAVSLPRSLTVTGVTDALAEGLVDAIDRACECTISSWEQEANTLTVLSVCEPGGIAPGWSIATMRSAVTRTSPTRPGAPVPSTINPFRSTWSTSTP
jgi:hypothetical protein